MSHDKDLDHIPNTTENLLVDAEGEAPKGVDDRAQFEPGFDRLERRLREDEKRVLRQRRRVLELRAKHADGRIAEELLQVFEDMLAVRRVLMMRLREGQARRCAGG
ncbi:MAG TPA: hypothetical protein VKZ79_19570 [Alphaproteobacteria bacterium]|nr:hypothetical protein [Alphaproteobacteria bacterium]